MVKKELLKNKKALWNFRFNNQLNGFKVQLAGLGVQSIKFKLIIDECPHFDAYAFLSWASKDKWSAQEQKLVQELVDAIN